MDPMTPTQVMPGTTGVDATVVVTVPKEPRPSALQTKVQDARSKIEAYAIQEPVKAMAIALVAGYVVGKAVSALFSVRSKHKNVERVIIRTPRDIEEWPA